MSDKNDLGEPAGEDKSPTGETHRPERHSYFPFFADDWAGGVVGFTLEQEGFYLRILRTMWMRKGVLKDDIKWLAVALNCDHRIVSRLRDFLITEGKIRSQDGLLVNDKMMAVIGVKSPRRKPELRPRSGPARGLAKPQLGVQLDGSYGLGIQKNPMNSTRAPARLNPSQAKPYSIGVCSNPKSQTTDVESSAAAPPPIDTKVLSERLSAAANGSLSTISPALMSMHIPLWWIEQGADLERDVIPAITIVSGRKRHKPIQSWDYFTHAVTEAKAKREAGLPSVEISDNSASGTRPRSYQDRKADANVSALEGARLAMQMFEGNNDEHTGSNQIHDRPLPEALRLASPASRGRQ